MSFVFLVVFFHSVGWIDLPEDVLQVVGGWLMLAWFGFGLALFSRRPVRTFEIRREALAPASSYLLFPLSGAAFIVDALPQQAQEFVLLLPMVHGVEFVREGYFGSQDRGALRPDAIWRLCNLVLTLVGLAQERRLSQIAGARMIPLTDVNKVYPTRGGTMQVLRDVNLTVNRANASAFSDATVPANRP